LARHEQEQDYWRTPRTLRGKHLLVEFDSFFIAGRAYLATISD
jgi:hypothetical protein